MNVQHTLKEDEYLDHNSGLICCIACHTPRQARIRLLGKETIVFTLCKCRQETQRKEEEKQKLRAIHGVMEKLRYDGITDSSLLDCRFSQDTGYNPRESRIARSYVTQWEKMKETGKGLLFWGMVGSGKSFLAGCIAHELIMKDEAVLAVKASHIPELMMEKGSDRRTQFLERLHNCALLVLDDLGAERNSDFAAEQIFNVVDSHCGRKRPIIATSNLTPANMKAESDIRHSRIYSRILERCAPVRVSNGDIRRIAASENLKQSRRVLLSQSEDSPEK